MFMSAVFLAMQKSSFSTPFSRRAFYPINPLFSADFSSLQQNYFIVYKEIRRELTHTSMRLRISLFFFISDFVIMFSAQWGVHVWHSVTLSGLWMSPWEAHESVVQKTHRFCCCLIRPCYQTRVGNTGLFLFAYIKKVKKQCCSEIVAFYHVSIFDRASEEISAWKQETNRS